MLLPRGITGFDVPKGHTGTDLATLRADCWHAVAARNGRVEELPQVEYPDNFRTLRVVLPGQELVLLLNKVHPWLAFTGTAKPIYSPCPFTYVQPDAALFRRMTALGRYRVLSLEEATQPLEDAMLAELGKAELHELKYWRDSTSRVGDVVFNFWD